MQAGRELDALVAEKVMGCTTLFYGTDGVTPFCNCGRKTAFDNGEHEDGIGLKPYSTDIAAAFEVVAKLTSGRDKFMYNSLYREPNFGKWLFGSVDSDGSFSPWLEADTAPLAICLAALDAVGFNPAP
jgi:hypothetical protein